MTRQLVIFAKYPASGRVKTRLARDVGTSRALQFYRSSLSSLLRRVGHDARWHTRIALAPDTARALPGQEKIATFPQGSGDLGARMGRVFENVPPGPVVIIGADIPGITAAHIAHAFALLGRNDAVLGPAHDGGYWLVGLKRSPNISVPFHGVRWSSPHALGDTLKNLRGKKVALLNTLVDVDTGADLALSETR